VTRIPKFLGLQTKVPARKNDTHLLRIHTQISDYDSDFVQPHTKRNRVPKLKTCNVPRPDIELPPKQVQKVMTSPVTIYNKNVIFTWTIVSPYTILPVHGICSRDIRFNVSRIVENTFTFYINMVIVENTLHN
jgi:hypothetical protein